MQSARQRDHQAQTLSGGNTLRHSPVYAATRPTDALSEGLITFVKDKRPEVTLLISLSYYASKPYEGVIVSFATVSVGPQLKISEAMPKTQNKWQAIEIVIKPSSGHVSADVPTTE